MGEASAHAKLSPSAAERWYHCPGSVMLSEGIPQKDSPHAAEGTQAHDVAEKILKNLPIPEGTSKEMIANLRSYTDYVNEIFADADVKMIEKKVEVNLQCWGTADAIVWNETTKTLYVTDLKYGVGVGVEVRGNLQLKIYGLGALLTCKYPAKRIVVTIAQPRYNHPDGPIRSVEYDAVDLMEFHGDLIEAFGRVAKAKLNYDLYKKWEGTTNKLELDGRAEWEEKYLKATEKGCRWCLAAPTCPVLKRTSLEVAKSVFATIEVPEPAGMTTVYNVKELAATLSKLDLLEAWIKNCREFAYNEAERGVEIPGYKLVAKQASRKFKPGIVDALADALGLLTLELYSEPEMLGITEIQKMAPGKNDAERAKALEPFVTKESTGHTLVLDSDKRPAIRVDAKAAFSVLS